MPRRLTPSAKQRFNRVMKRMLVTITMASLTPLVGCTAPQAHAPGQGVLVGKGGANLALGPTAEYGALAAEFNQRSDWPATSTGYRLPEISDYTEVLFDDQLIPDAFNFSFRVQQSFRSGTMIR